LFKTMETVAGEKPVALATSRIVTSLRLPFAFMSASLARLSSGHCAANCKSKKEGTHSSGGISNERVSRKPLVFHTPKAMPAAIQMDPTIMAGRLKFSHNARQIMKPKTGGARNVSLFSVAYT
jgi:hypothetical protein